MAVKQMSTFIREISEEACKPQENEQKGTSVFQGTNISVLC